MRNRLDQLFKNKLSDHTVAPSVNAWNRVKDGLAKKNNKPFLLRIAASVLLVGALTTTLLWLSSKDRLPNSSASSSIGKKAESKTHRTTPTNPSQQSVSARKQKTAEQGASKKKKRSEKQDNGKVHTIIEDQNNVNQSVITTEEPQQSPVPAGSVATVASQQKEEKPIVLVYRLETIEKRHVVGSAAPPELKEQSGLLKVINFARDAKNGDGGLGDLRQAKDELFAFNFRKDKQNNHK